MGRNIIVTPAGGLGNRLRVIESCLSLSSKIQGGLLVIWQSSPDMVASYRELFHPHPDFRILDVNPRTRLLEKLIRNTTLRCGYRFLTDEDVIRNDYDLSGLLITNSKSLYINTCNTTHRFDRNFDWLRPNAIVDGKVNDYLPRVTQKTIGVHVRRTDNQWSIATSTDDKFFRYMDEAIHADDSVEFFLCTDCEATEETFRNRYAARVFSRKKQFGRERIESIQDALADWILLSECGRIFHSHWSSFSFTAAYRKRAKLIEIK
jgi:hypothetical protein